MFPGKHHFYWRNDRRGGGGAALNKAIRKLWCSCSVSNLFSRKFRLLLYRNTCAAANDHHRKSDSVAVFVWHSICATECEPPCTGSMVHDEYFKRFDGTIEKLWNFILNYLFGYRPRLGDETMSRFWIYDQTIISPMVSEPRKFILIREIALDEMRAVFRNSDNKHVAGFSLCTRRLINNSDSFVVL